jgi:uncharacterized YigZ family protein
VAVDVPAVGAALAAVAAGRSRYAIPASRHRAELVIDRSRFICTVAPVRAPEDAQAFIREMNVEFADATHNCWAFVIGVPGSTDRIGMSDDGEPHGTAGRPMLTVLLHSGIGDIVAVVTRYYGGTKLGTGGLVKAYGGAVQHALEELPRAEHREFEQLTVTVSYAHISACQQLWPVYEADVLGETYEADVRFALRCPVERVEALRQALMDATRGQALVIGTDRNG